MLLAGVIAGGFQTGGGGGVPALIAHIAVQQASSFTQPGPTTSGIDTTGANFLVMCVNAYDNQYGGNDTLDHCLIADGFGSAPTVFDGAGGDSYSGSSLTINGTFTGGGSNAFAGLLFCVAGYSTQPQNNGYWMCTASGATSITLTVPGGASAGSTSSVKCAISSNTWIRTPIGSMTNSLGGGSIWYAVNATVGANHYFVEDDRPISASGDGSSFAVAAFSGVKNTSTYVQSTNGSQISSGTSVAGAAITPTVNNLLICFITGLNITGPQSVDSSFTTTDTYVTGSGLYSPIGMAYLVPGSGSSVTPTWTVGNVGVGAYCHVAEFAHS